MQPIPDKYINLDLLSPKNTINSLKAAIYLGTLVLSAKYPDIYDKTDKTILGVYLDDLYTVDLVEENGEDVPVIEIYLDELLKQIVFEKVGAGLLN